MKCVSVQRISLFCCIANVYLLFVVLLLDMVIGLICSTLSVLVVCSVVKWDPDSMVVGRRELLVIGPQCPWGSITNGKSAVLASKSSDIVLSLKTVVDVDDSFLLFHRYLFLSNVWRCFSVVAVKYF